MLSGDVGSRVAEDDRGVPRVARVEPTALDQKTARLKGFNSLGHVTVQHIDPAVRVDRGSAGFVHNDIPLVDSYFR